MKHLIHIRFSGMESSAALTTAAEAHAYGLTWASSAIIACWVGIRFDPAQESADPYSVRVDVMIPGHDLVATRAQHGDVHLALGYAFQDIEAQLRSIDLRASAAEYAVTVNGQLMTPETFEPTRPIENSPGVVARTS